MEKTILIAGKNMPDAGSFTDGVAFSGRNIIITGPQTDEVQPIKKLTIAERKANQAAYEEEKNLEAKSGINRLRFRHALLCFKRLQYSTEWMKRFFTLMKNGLLPKLKKWTARKLLVAAMK